MVGRRAIIIGLAMMVIMNACFADAPVQQQYSFGRLVDISKISQQKKDNLQRIINKLGDPPTNTITFNGFRTYYGQDGSLNVDVFIRNGYSYAVRNLEAKLELKANNETVAAGVILLPTAYLGEIPANSSKVWTITFKPEQILNKNASLESYVIESQCSFKH